MIEILAILSLLFVMLLIIAFIINKKLEIERESIENKYSLERRKLSGTSKRKKKDEDEDLEVEDFIDALPPWLASIAEGANIDLEAVYDGNPAELAKVKDLLEKNLPKLGGSNGNNEGGGLIG